MADEDSFGATQHFEPDSGESSADAALSQADATSTEHPESIGRYRIVKVLGDQEPRLWTELLICQMCVMGPVNLGQLIEARSTREASG